MKAIQGEIKKVIIGIIYHFGLEILFFAIAATIIYLLLMTVQHAMHLPPTQRFYFYDPNEVKYFIVVVGGYKKKVAIKKLYKKFCH